MNNFKTKEIPKKRFKIMSSLKKGISFLHNESEPEFEPYFYNNIILLS